MANGTCGIDDCGKPEYCRSLCRKHYTRLHRHGDPSICLNPHGDEVGRFWAKVELTQSCWLWTAATDPAGYGRFGLSKTEHRVVFAHRYAYELLIGPIADGLVIDHLCRIPPCVNPEHLEPVTHRTNLRRGEPAQRTHCVHGHYYSEDNTYVDSRGKRQCRTCNRLRYWRN